jgi:hypothetical protein
MAQQEERKADGKTETILVFRGGQVVSTLTGVFGHAVRETRITAVLGYLIALEPEPFRELFAFAGIVRKVGIETRHDDGRSDVLIETSTETCIIEAKLDASDPLVQSLRYGPSRIVLLCFRRTAPSLSRSRVRYVSWDDLAKLLRVSGRFPNQMSRLQSQDQLQYLEEKYVISKSKTVEIYAREINEEKTLRLFLKAQLYGCKYRAGSRLTEARYFAPHFGKRIANEYPGVTSGISYIAKVEQVLTLATWQELRDGLIDSRGKSWFNKHEEFVAPLRRFWRWPRQRSMLLLGAPRLAFNPPVRKENIQAGRGWLSKQFISFDELFAAWKL